MIEQDYSAAPRMPVGYLVKRPDGLRGERGAVYDYVLAGNGLWLETEGKFLAARVPVAGFNVRGLPPLEARVILRHGKIPQFLFDLALEHIKTRALVEKYVAIIWNEGYFLRFPEQESNEASVNYETVDDTVLEFHSHGRMKVFFSDQDDSDELGLRIYGVIGNCDQTLPLVKLRAGAYGYYQPLIWSDVFEGSLTGSLEYAEKIEYVPKEEKTEEGLNRRGVWWNRLFCHVNKAAKDG